ncbi:hypothetical protein vseg_008365 [Gypsophila vaccaria]
MIHNIQINTLSSENSSTSLLISEDYDVFDEQYSYLSEPLAIPEDPIEDLQWYPDFGADLISLSEISEDDDEKSWLYSPDESDLSPVSVIPDGVGFDFDTVSQNTNLSSPFASNFNVSKDDDAYFSTSSSEVLINQTEQNTKPSRNHGMGITNPTITKRNRTGGKAIHIWSKCNYDDYFTKSKPGNNDVIKCTHCQTTRTPQWREGPLGPKTLCNACGVRFKSGRLLPEYRPMASPTFNRDEHSNWHKQVLKIRGLRDSPNGIKDTTR